MRIVAVMSGKGGVGKTTTTVGVALALKELGRRPAILDLDIENPSLAGRDGVTGLTRDDLSFPGDLIVPPRWADIPVMSVSLLPSDDFEDIPALIDEEQKHFIIRHLVKEVDWADTEILVVDMPPGSGEEVRGLLQLNLDGAVIVTAPQRISEAAVRKVLVMAQEYHIPVLGVLENTVNGIGGDAGVRLMNNFGLPLLAQIPWSEDILLNMEDHEPIDHELFLPVAQVIADRVLMPEPEVPSEATPEEALAPAAQTCPEPSRRDGPGPQGSATAHDASARSAQALGIYVDDTPPWRVFSEFSDREWEELRALLPKHMRGGRRGLDDRALLNGIFWVFTTRRRWDQMPARYGNHWTAESRLKRWREQGAWEPILEKARSFGYAMTEGDFFEHANSAEDHHEGILSNGDDPGQQAWPGSESEAEVPAGSPAERAD